MRNGFKGLSKAFVSGRLFLLGGIMKEKKRLFIGLLLMAIVVKFIYFYKMTDVRNNYLVLVVVTSLVYTGLLILTSKKRWLMLPLVFILTLLFEGELLYFRYFNKLLSFSNMSQAKFAGEVSGIVFGLIRLSDLILLLDLLIIVIVLIKKSQVLKHAFKDKLVLLFMVVLMIPFVILSTGGNTFAISVVNQEFFMYHIVDVFEVMNPVEEMVVVPEIIEEVVEEITIEKNYRGLFEGKNLITIQVESLQDMMLLSSYKDQEIMPFLNRLIKEDSFYFSSYYQQLGKGNTSDSEFSSHNSLYPSMDGISYERYKDYDFKGLPVLLKERGYETLAFHGNSGAFWGREGAYPNQGLSNYYSAEKLNMDEIIGMGLSDVSLFEQSINILKEVSGPFYGFYITLTNHNPYDIPESLVTIDVTEADKKLLFGRYIESVKYTDDAIKVFYENLQENGLLENTVIIIYGDHHGIPSMTEDNQKRVSEFLGHDYDFDEMMNIPLIIHAPGTGIIKQDDHVFDQQDLLPTLYNLFAMDASLHMMGQDMLNTEDYYALFQTYMVKGSFMQDDIVFEMSRDGVFENSRAYHRKTREPVDLKLCEPGYKRALYELALSKYLLENNKVIKNIK